MKAKELTCKILRDNGFTDSEEDIMECFIPVAEPLDTGDTEVYYRRLYMYHNFINSFASQMILSFEFLALLLIFSFCFGCRLLGAIVEVFSIVTKL